jgi:hypothetical protein
MKEPSLKAESKIKSTKSDKKEKKFSFKKRIFLKFEAAAVNTIQGDKDSD